MKKVTQDRKYRLMIRILDNESPIQSDDNGNNWIPTRWIEVPEANLGSMSKESKDIIEFKFEPLNLESNTKGKNILGFKGFRNLTKDDLNNLGKFFGVED